MKKILCIMLSVLMILSVVAFADVSGEVSYSETAQTVYIAGDLKEAGITGGRFVTLLITDKQTDEIKHIKEIEVGEDRKYETKFKFNGDLDDCDISIKEGDRTVEDSVTAAYVNYSVFCSFSLRDENGNHVIDPKEYAHLTATIDNRFGDGSTYKIMVAFYSEDGRLNGFDIVAEGEFAYGDIKIEVDDIKAVEVPEGAVKIKAFIWENSKEAIPVSKNHERNVSDKKFGGDTQQIRVAFIGDSITNYIQYTKAIEHYYHTRYPNKDIVFTNKGIAGNTTKGIIERMDWDIAENEVTGDIDEATIMIGMNDLLVVPMTSSATMETYIQDKTTQQTKRDTYFENLRTIVEFFKEKGIALTFITSSLHDEFADFEGGSATTYYPGGNSILGEGMAALKDFAAEYDIPVIDLWTPTTAISDTVRETDYTGGIITSTDRIHPSEQGGFYMGYQFAKQQDGNPIVAKVEIDVSDRSIETENAEIKLLSSSKTNVEYEYLAGAIPLAYNKHYKKFENEWNVPITEDINQEIIKVAGLSEGTYTVTIGDNVLSKTYTASELAEGINIAIDENNPAQIQAMQTYEINLQKATNEETFRRIARTEAFLWDRKYNALKDVDAIGPSSTEEELKAVLGSLCGATQVKLIFDYFSEDPTNYASKNFEAANWAKLVQQAENARSIAKPVKRTVVIEKQ